MCLNPVNEEFDRAYANVGLLASDVWSCQNEEVDYKKANLYLWIRFNETEKRLIEDDSSDDLSTSTEVLYAVQDIIPFSRLATYNNFEYNEGREKIYVTDDESVQYIQNSYHVGHKDIEVWMWPEVEKEFKRYTKGSQSGWCMLSPRYPSGRELVSIDRITNASPQKWLCETQWPNRLLSHYAEKLYCLKLSTNPSLFRDDLEPPALDPEEVEMKLMEYPCPKYLVETNIDHRLHEMINSPTIRNLWATPSYPYGSYRHNFGLNAEVPEFQPVTFSSKLKVEGENFDPMNTPLHQIVHGFPNHEASFGARQQYYVSIFDTNYEAEVFPYSSMFNKYDVDPEIMQIETNEELQPNATPVNPSGLYFNLELLRSNWKNQQGYSSANIVTLPDSEMNGIAEQQLEPWINHLDGGQSMNINQNTEKMIAFLEKWVTKIYQPRSIDFNQMNSSSGRINKIFQNVQQGYCLLQGPLPIVQPPVQRPLYSDVLMSDANPAETNSETKFDELEQEALEQYSGSDTLIPPPPSPPAKVSENLNASEKSTPRLLSQDLKPPVLTSFPYPSDKEHMMKAEKLTTHHSSEESITSRQSHLSEKIFEEIQFHTDTCNLKSQAKWIKKSKKKVEKKKKNSKDNKKKSSPHENNKKYLGTEIMLINKYLVLPNTFDKTFSTDDWKLIQDQLTVQVKNTLEWCLRLFEDCSNWFIFLIMEKDNLIDFNNKQRLYLMKKIISLSENLLIAVKNYLSLYNKIKVAIPCDHRLYFDPDKFIRQRPVIFPHLDTISSTEDNFCCNRVKLLATVPNGKYFLRLLNSVVQEERLTLNFKQEWKLPQVSESYINRRSYEIQINFKEWRIRLADLEMGNEEPISNVSHKLVKIVEDSPTWYSWQWKFIDGWKLDMNDSTCSFHWCNRFNVKILEQIATSARLFVMYDWILELIDAVVLNKHFSSCEVLWNRKTPNLVSSKMVFYRLLLQKERDWYFGDVRISQQACCHLYSGCENQYCVTWMLNEDSRNVNKGANVSLASGHKSRIPGVRPARSRCKKEETKKAKSRSKSKSKKSCSPKAKILFNQIHGVSEKINLNEEEPKCVIQ